MTFRISTERCAGLPTTIRVAGRLAGDAVDVLRGACGDLGPAVTIDLSEVSYADDAGVGALGELRARGAVLQSPRPYLALLL
jgi:anti-anti-sigma regulatory factor